MPDNNNEDKISVTRPAKRLWTECNPIDQPEGTYRFMLNGLNGTQDGNENFVSNENSNVNLATSIQSLLGTCYLGNETNLIFSLRDDDDSEIGILNKDDVYTSLIVANLGFLITNQIDAIMRVRNANQRVVYFVDGNIDAKCVNIDALYEHYTQDYKNWINNGSVGSPPPQWNLESFNLVKVYSSIPEFTDIKIGSTGTILAGSYSAAIRFLDSDLNPTNFITTSNPINIYNDDIVNSYENIHGSKNIHSPTQDFSATNKSIEFRFDNMDNNFPYYQIAIIQSNSTKGSILKVVTSQPIPINNLSWIYLGNDEELTSIDISEIIIDKLNIKKPKVIEQIENRVILANGIDNNYEWCTFQQYASTIKSDLDTHQTILGDMNDVGETKNPLSSFILRGFMPGEVECFGIVYLMEDLSISPVFHIPGPEIGDITTKIKGYELTIGYDDIHNCDESPYWGNTYNSNPLLGQRVRHHRFPFRSELSFPEDQLVIPFSLFNSLHYSYNINIALATVYPILSGQPQTLTFSVRYKLLGIPSVFTKTLILTESLIGVDIVFYEGNLDIDFDFIPITTNLDLVIFTPTFNPVVTTILNRIPTGSFTYPFGIRFSNIVRPIGTIGFYIVKAERLDDDKIINDYGIIGPNVLNNGYSAFVRWNPQIFEDPASVPAGHIAVGYTQTQEQDLNNSWLFSPEHQFFNKKNISTQLQIEGEFKPTKIYYPYSITNAPSFGSDCSTILDDLQQLGVMLRDVQAGNKYLDDTSTIAHVKFRLHAYWKVSDYLYDNHPTKAATSLLGENIDTDRFFHINAVDYKIDDTSIFYNASSDNKIIHFKYKASSFGNAKMLLETDGAGLIQNRYGINDTNDDYFAGVHHPNIFNLFYVAMLSGKKDVYSDYLTRTYYKQHNNPVYFDDVNNSISKSIAIYGGDTTITAYEPVNSNYIKYHRQSQHTQRGILDIVLGALIIAGSVVVDILTAGATTVASVGSITYGLSLLNSGIKLENMRAMQELDYKNGLFDCIEDFEVWQMENRPCSTIDEDIFKWYSDVAHNIFIESSVGASLRCPLTSHTSSFLNTKLGYTGYQFIKLENYLKDKFSYVDGQITTGAGSNTGRLYRGYASAEIYDINLDFNRINKEKTFYQLPITYDCCSLENNVFKTRVWYSQQSFQEETIDNYRIFLPNNYRDIESEHGEITDLFRRLDNLYVHCEEALWLLPKNLQERVTGQITSFIGTGSFFDVPPKPVSDDDLGSGGSQHKLATVKTKKGVFFANQKENKLYWLDDEGLKLISIIGMQSYFMNNLYSFFNEVFYSITGYDYPYLDNPSNFNGLGLIATYDNYYNRIILSKKDYLLEDGYLLVIGAPDSTPNTIWFYNNTFYTVIIVDDIPAIGEIFLNDTTYFKNLSWTMSFSIDDMAFIGWHSYLPDFLFRTQNEFFAYKHGKDIYKHNRVNHYQTFFDTYYPFIIDYVSIANPLTIKTWESIMLNTQARIYRNNVGEYMDIIDSTFNKAIFYNSKQSSGLQTLVVKDLQTPESRYLGQQIKNTLGSILISRRENYWHINDIRDYVINYNVPLFSKKFSDIASQYYIDKVPNSPAISNTKNWYEVQVLRDKYLQIRLFFDDSTKVTTNITFQYSLETKNTSIR